MTEFRPNIDGLVQERCNSSALAMELCLSCTNPTIYIYICIYTGLMKDLYKVFEEPMKVAKCGFPSVMTSKTLMPIIMSSQYDITSSGMINELGHSDYATNLYNKPWLIRIIMWFAAQIGDSPQLSESGGSPRGFWRHFRQRFTMDLEVPVAVQSAGPHGLWQLCVMCYFLRFYDILSFFLGYIYFSWVIASRYSGCDPTSGVWPFCKTYFNINK